MSVSGTRRSLVVMAVVISATFGGIASATTRAAAATVAYEIEDIGRPKSATGGILAGALNDDAVIVGVAFTAKGDRPYIYKRGKFKYLDDPTFLATVSDINADEQVVGDVTDLATSPSGSNVPMLWQDGEPTELPSLGGDGGSAGAINDAGIIVGSAQIESDADTLRHAVVWQEGKAVDLGTASGVQSAATDINDTGQIAGFSMSAEGASRAVLWQDGEPLDLGTLGGRSSASAINDPGQIVGDSATDADDPSAPSHAFLWQDGEMIDLGGLKEAPSSTANDINNAGQIVGSAANFEAFTDFAVIWEEGKIKDLNTVIPNDTGLTLFSALAINERGQILANATADDDPTTNHVVLLTPADSGAAYSEREGTDEAANAHFGIALVEQSARASRRSSH